MGLVEINWNPSPRELRNFAVACLVAPALIATLFYLLKVLEIEWSLIIFAVGFTAFLCSIISLKAARIIYLSLTVLTLPIGVVVSFVMLAAFYFLIITPTGLLFRLIGRDQLNLNFDKNTESYWQMRHEPESPDSYFHQF